MAIAITAIMGAIEGAGTTVIKPADTAAAIRLQDSASERDGGGGGGRAAAGRLRRPGTLHAIHPAE